MLTSKGQLYWWWQGENLLNGCEVSIFVSCYFLFMLLMFEMIPNVSVVQAWRHTAPHAVWNNTSFPAFGLKPKDSFKIVQFCYFNYQSPISINFEYVKRISNALVSWKTDRKSSRRTVTCPAFHAPFTLIACPGAPAGPQGACLL